jgi:predicted ArsR family transcriptional regulator
VPPPPRSPAPDLVVPNPDLAAESAGVPDGHQSGPATASSGPGGHPGLSNTDFASAVTAITSAFGDPTRRDIYLFARDADGGATAAQVAERFDLHPNVARHHLDKLASGGYLEVEVTRSARSGAGRPSKHYRVGPRGPAIEFPVRHDDLLVTLLGKALARLPRDEAEGLAEEVGVEYGRLMATSLGVDGDVQRSFRSALHAVAEALTAHGFAAHAEKHDRGLRIVAEHCPFGDAVIDNPVICAVDRGMVKGMLGALYRGPATTELESSLPQGDEHCVTTVAE